MGSTESRRASVLRSKGADVWQFPRRRCRSALRRAPRRSLTLAMAAVVAGPMVLLGCGGDEGGAPTLTWYINPDNGGQAELAKKCGDASNGRVPHRDADPAQRSRPAARAAGAAPRRRRPVGRSDEPRPTVRRRVCQRRLPPADHEPGRRQVVHRRRPRSPARHRVLGRPTGGAPVLGQHAVAVVPQVGRRGSRRGSHGRRLHVGSDDRGRRVAGQADRSAVAALRGLHGLDQRPHRLRWRGDHREPRARCRRDADRRVSGRGQGRRHRRQPRPLVRGPRRHVDCR